MPGSWAMPPVAQRLRPVGTQLDLDRGAPTSRSVSVPRRALEPDLAALRRPRALVGRDEVHRLGGEVGEGRELELDRLVRAGHQPRRGAAPALGIGDAGHAADGLDEVLVERDGGEQARRARLRRRVAVAEVRLEERVRARDRPDRGHPDRDRHDDEHAPDPVLEQVAPDLPPPDRAEGEHRHAASRGPGPRVRAARRESSRERAGRAAGPAHGPRGRATAGHGAGATVADGGCDAGDRGGGRVRGAGRGRRARHGRRRCRSCSRPVTGSAAGSGPASCRRAGSSRWARSSSSPTTRVIRETAARPRPRAVRQGHDVRRPRAARRAAGDAPGARRGVRRGARGRRARAPRGTGPSWTRSRRIPMAEGARDAIRARIEVSTAYPADDQDADVLHESGTSVGGFATHSVAGRQPADRARARRAARVDRVRLRTPVDADRLRRGRRPRDRRRRTGRRRTRSSIAVPASVIDLIVFDPPLPERKARALAGVRYGSAAKLFLPLDRPDAAERDAVRPRPLLDVHPARPGRRPACRSRRRSPARRSPWSDSGPRTGRPAWIESRRRHPAGPRDPPADAPS